MFATTTTKLDRSPAERAVCMVLAAFIVTVGLATGALGMHVAERNAVATWVKQALWSLQRTAFMENSCPSVFNDFFLNG